MKFSSEEKARIENQMRKFFSPQYQGWTSMMLLRYALVVKNVGLRTYEAVPVTFIPDFDNFSILDRFSGRTDFCYNKSMDRYILLTPIQEKLELDEEDIDLEEFGDIP